MRLIGGTLFLLTFTSVILAEKLRGKTVCIADDDTITYLDADNKQHKVRLTGIDAPEKKQAFATKSKDSLSKLVAGSKLPHACGGAPLSWSNAC